jgi:tetratricopeptide (TPR) repeat protein
MLIVVFASTQYLVNLHRRTELELAQSWFSRGDRAMKLGYPDIAAEDYRTALSYNREDVQSRLRLAEALLAGGHYQEARSHLLSLWEEDPANGEVNLALARLNVKLGNKKAAERYFRNAINGVWDSDPREQRIATRFALVRYLLQQHDTQQATAELIALQADPPEAQEVDRRLDLGGLLLETGEYARAQGVFESVLKTNPHNAEAWLGDGRASFAMNDFRAAEMELASAVEHDPNLSEAKQQLDLTREVLSIAPGLRGLSVAERAHRAAQAFRVAFARLTGCAAQKAYRFTAPSAAPEKNASASSAGGTPASTAALTAAPDNLQQLYLTGLSMKNTATDEALRKHPDSLESTMDFAFDVERATQPLCSDLSLSDRALLVLAEQQTKTTL